MGQSSGRLGPSMDPPPPNLSKPMQNQCFALRSLLERPQSDVETAKPFWIDFPSIFKANLPPTWPQLGSQNPPKSLKNRCQDALYFGLHFLIDFGSILGPNLDLLDLKKRGFSLGKIKCKIQCILASLYERCWWILGAKLEASWPEKSMGNRSKKAWAFPHRSGGVPGGSRAVREPKILILRGLGRRVRLSRAEDVRPLKR